jgi:hypothetical protein
VTSESTLSSDHLGLRKHQIWARIGIPGPNNTNAQVLSSPFPVIEFEIEEPAVVRAEEKRGDRKKASNLEQLSTGGYCGPGLVNPVHPWGV